MNAMAVTVQPPQKADDLEKLEETLDVLEQKLCNKQIIRRRRAPRACARCHLRKVRCDLASSKESGCTNCRLDGDYCIVLPQKGGKRQQMYHKSVVTIGTRWMSVETNISQRRSRWKRPHKTSTISNYSWSVSPRKSQWSTITTICHIRSAADVSNTFGSSAPQHHIRQIILTARSRTPQATGGIITYLRQ